MMWWNFHFLRPWWLLLLPLILLPLWRLASRSRWEQVIDAHLVPYVIAGYYERRRSFNRLLWALFLALLIIALAGPTLEKIPTDTGFNKAPLIVCLELSEHMLSKDINPNRLQRATFKLQDLLNQYKGAEVALIAFAGDAHVVVPLTDDYNTILTLAKVLKPDTMPVKGVELAHALDVAKEMGERQPQAMVLVLTSTNFEPNEALKHSLQQLNAPILLWAFATEAGAPIESVDGRFDHEHGQINLSKLRSDVVAKMASFSAVVPIAFTSDSQDVLAIVEYLNKAKSVLSKKELYFDSWYDLGPYLLALAMMIFLYVNFFAKEQFFLFGFLILISCFDAKAFIGDWFLRKDQQAQRALENGQPLKAAELFEDDFRKGSSYYRAKDYQKAIMHLSKVNTPDGHYNLGNAYAFNGQIREAIAAYQEAIKLDPKHEDAKANKELLEKQLKEDPPKSDQANEKHEQDDSSQKNQSDQKDNQPESSQPKNQNNASGNESPGQASEKDNKQSDAKSKDKNPGQAPSFKEEDKKPGEQQQPLKQSSSPEGSESMDQETRYYLDRIKSNEALYLKRKFDSEFRKRQERQ